MFNADTNTVRRYFDHGATSFPKPSAVGDAMLQFLNKMGGPYGRSAYTLAYETSSMVFDAREILAGFIGATDSSQVVFTQNATHAINLAIHGLVAPGQCVLVSPLEHNAVMRPLSFLEKKRGIRYEVLPHDNDGRILTDKITPKNDVSLAIVNLQSNVNGVVQPVAKIKEKLGSIPLLVDGAQGVGEHPLDVHSDHIDLLAITGHKQLLGPTGIGALYVQPNLKLPPLMQGGTGSRSSEMVQPDSMPDAHESGTPNLVGIAGLRASLNFLNQNAPNPAASHCTQIIAGLETHPRIRLTKANTPNYQGTLFSFNIDGMSCSQTAQQLHQRFGISVRAGLHCAPFAHKTLGTLNQHGTVRIAPGYFHTESDCEYLIKSVLTIANSL